MNEKPKSPIRFWRWCIGVPAVLLSITVGSVLAWNVRVERAVREIQQLGGRVTYDSVSWLPDYHNDGCVLEDIWYPAPLAMPGEIWIERKTLTAAEMVTLSAAADLVGIRWITILDSRIEDLTPLARVRSLRKLWFMRNSGFAGQLHALAPLSLLEEANLDDSALTDADVAALAHLPRLAVLSLANTGVTDAGVASLVALPKLNFIGLDGTAVTDAVIPTLEAMPALTQVSLSGTAVSESELEALATRKTDFTFSND